MFEYGILAGALIVLAFYLRRCSFRVEEGHVAVLTTFGRAEHEPGDPKKLRIYRAGLSFKWPWQKAVTVSTKEQNLDLSGEEGGRTAMADDGTILRFDSILRYVPVERDLYRFMFGLNKPLEHITELFTCLLRNEIANFRAPATPAHVDSQRAVFDEQGGSYALIRRERNLLNGRIAEFCQNEVGNRYGVRFAAVDLKDILPPDELADALTAVIHATAAAAAAFFRAEGECQQRVLASEAGVEIAKARARAAETEILLLGGHLAELDRASVLDAYIDRRRKEVYSESRARFVREEASR